MPVGIHFLDHAMRKRLLQKASEKVFNHTFVRSHSPKIRYCETFAIFGMQLKIFTFVALGILCSFPLDQTGVLSLQNFSKILSLSPTSAPNGGFILSQLI